jgi:thiopeptide-type bacteriocin biosynthesis protein
VIDHAVVFWKRSNLPVFRFLGVLQQQASAMWSWGALTDAPFVPRVMLNGAILTRATWILKWPDIAPEKRSVDGLLEYLKRRELPDEFATVDGGGELTEMTIGNRPALEELLLMLRRGGAVVVAESLARSQAIAGGPEGAFVQECIIPFRREPAAKRPPVTAFPPAPDRVRPPGSRWTTAKIYSGPAEVDRIIREDLTQGVAELGDALINHHFVRYYDPDHHVRLRFETEMPETARAVVDRLFANIIEHRAVRVSYDSYRPESWRYGGPAALPLIERMFTNDSDAVRRVLMQEENGGSRWLSALVNMDAWLDSFAFDLDAKRVFVENARNLFMQEFDIKSVGAMSALIPRELVAEGGAALDDAASTVRSVFAERTAKSAVIVAELHAMESRGDLSRPVKEILWSLIHMSVNRLVKTRPRQQEACLYHVLSRYYVARMARSAKS